MLLFDETGTVAERAKIDAGTLDRAVEVGENRWHSLLILAAETLLVEIKPGPYVPPPEHDFAPWSPKEGDAQALEFEKWLRSAQPGDTPPHPI
jgi:cupin fold WbuC family metalloprotein